MFLCNFLKCIVSILFWPKAPFQSNCFQRPHFVVYVFSLNLKVRCHFSPHPLFTVASPTIPSPLAQCQTILLSFFYFPRLTYILFLSISPTSYVVPVENAVVFL